MSNVLIKDNEAVYVETAEWILHTPGQSVPPNTADVWYAGGAVGGYLVGSGDLSVVVSALERFTRTLVSAPSAWDAGARSEAFCLGDCVATFKVPPAVGGALCGLSHNYAASGALSEVTWGFLVNGGHIYACPSSGVPSLLPDAPAVGTVYKLIRRGTQISYFVDDQLRLTDTDPYPSAPIFMVASLFADDDSIVDPVLRAMADADMTLPLLRMVAYQGAAYASVSMQMLPLTMSSKPASRAALVMRTLTMGNGARAAMALRPLRLLATAGVRGAQMEMQPMLMFGYAETLNDASMRSFAVPGGSLGGSALVFVLMNALGTVAATLVATPILSATLASQLSASTLLSSVLAFADALMRSVVLVGADVPLADETGEAWAINVTTNASSKYEDYPFNSFARVGSNYYGARQDGIYLLAGNDDNGTPIHASLSLGRHGFGTLNKKHINSVSMGASSSDTLFLKVIVEQGAGEEVEYVYAARNFKQAMSTQRMHVGRGIRATYLTFELFNKEGSDFELDQVEFEIVDTMRSTG